MNLRAVLVVGLLTLQAVAVLATIFLTGAAMRPALVKQMDQQMSSSAEIVLSSTEAVLQTTADSAEITQRAVSTGLVSTTDPKEIELFLRDELDANTDITAISFGLPDGAFVVAERPDRANPDSYRTRITEFATGDRVTTVYQYDTSGNETSHNPDANDQSDPRQQDWYRSAENTDGSTEQWTNPYIFGTTKRPGLTASLAVHQDYYDPKSPLVGVVAVDVELTQLSNDLRETVDVTEHGTALVVDRNGTVITTRNPDTVTRPEGNNSFRTARLDELGDVAARNGFESGKDTLATIAPNHQTIVAFEVDGEPYRAVFAPLDEHGNWYVMVAASEQDYLGEVQHAQRVNAVIAVIVGLLIVVIALPFLLYLARRGERLQQRANTDVLTGLANRRHFEEVLEARIARAHDRKHELSVAMLDLDHFKGINDTHGHGVGDEALISVAKDLTHSVRDDDLVARLGGDEFAILLDGENLDGALSVLERARLLIEQSPLTAGDQTVQIRITAGVADLIPGVADNAALLRRADQALYVAKERGRNQVASIRDVDPAVAGITVPSAPVHTPSAPPE